MERRGRPLPHHLDAQREAEHPDEVVDERREPAVVVQQQPDLLDEEELEEALHVDTLPRAEGAEAPLQAGDHLGDARLEVVVGVAGVLDPPETPVRLAVGAREEELAPERRPEAAEDGPALQVLALVADHEEVRLRACDHHEAPARHLQSKHRPPRAVGVREEADRVAEHGDDAADEGEAGRQGPGVRTGTVRSRLSQDRASVRRETVP